MSFLSVLFVAIGLSMDAFSVAVTDGLLLRDKIRLPQALKIGLFFGVFQAVMPCIGYFAASFAAGKIEKIDHWIAFLLLGFLGVRMIIEAVREEKTEEEQKVKNPLSLSTLTLMAIATSIDALAVGISFAAIQVPLLSSVLIIGVTTFLLSVIAVYIGKKFGDVLGAKAEIIGGLILIVIGVKILIEHLM